MFEQLKATIRNTMLTFNFYRFNSYSIPGIEKLLCHIGLHDFEAQNIIYDRRGAPIGVRLMCFYCEHLKESMFSRQGELPLPKGRGFCSR